MLTFGFIYMFQTAVEKLGWTRYISTINTSYACVSTCENAWSVKSVSVQNSFCSLQLLPRYVVQTNRSEANCLKSSLLFLCVITQLLILKGIVLKCKRNVFFIPEFERAAKIRKIAVYRFLISLLVPEL